VRWPQACERCSRRATHLCFTSWPGTVSSQLPPASAARSTTTLPSRMASTMARVMSLGAGLPGISAVVTMMSTSATEGADTVCVRDHASMKPIAHLPHLTFGLLGEEGHLGGNELGGHLLGVPAAALSALGKPRHLQELGPQALHLLLHRGTGVEAAHDGAQRARRRNR